MKEPNAPEPTDVGRYEERAKAKAEEIARRGREIYEERIRTEEFDREHDGEFLVVDTTTGDYAAGDDDEILTQLEERNPHGLFHLMRVGRKAAHRIAAERIGYVAGGTPLLKTEYPTTESDPSSATRRSTNPALVPSWSAISTSSMA